MTYFTYEKVMEIIPEEIEKVYKLLEPIEVVDDDDDDMVVSPICMEGRLL